MGELETLGRVVALGVEVLLAVSKRVLEVARAFLGTGQPGRAGHVVAQGVREALVAVMQPHS
jgi:hypothetical protein